MKLILELNLEKVDYPNLPDEETYYTDATGTKLFGFKAGKEPWTWKVLINNFGKKWALPIIESYCESLSKGREFTQKLTVIIDQK